jgi:NlpC/P60 family putative phage cell wall peptidase
VDGSIAAPSRAAIIAEARNWLGTPYRHQASAKGAGCDCLGLVRGIWRALYGAEPESAPAYTPDWAELRGQETLRDAARRHLREIDSDEARPGDVLLFRMSASAPMKHAAIISAPDRIIHAYWGRAVVESRMTPFWRAKLAAAFVFPGVQSWRN